MTYMGQESKKKQKTVDIGICIAESLCCTPKTTQPSKPTTVQFKKKKDGDLQASFSIVWKWLAFHCVISLVVEYPLIKPSLISILTIAVIGRLPPVTNSKHPSKRCLVCDDF